MKILIRDVTTDKELTYTTDSFFFANIVSKENDKSISVTIRKPKTENEQLCDLVCVLERIKK